MGEVSTRRTALLIQMRALKQPYDKLRIQPDICSICDQLKDQQKMMSEAAESCRLLWAILETSLADFAGAIVMHNQTRRGHSTTLPVLVHSTSQAGFCTWRCKIAVANAMANSACMMWTASFNWDPQ